MKPAPPEQAALGGQAVTRWVVLAIPCTGMVVGKCPEGPRPPPRADHCPLTSSSSRCWEQEAPGQDSWLHPPRRPASPPGLTVNSSDRPGYF